MQYRDDISDEQRSGEISMVSKNHGKFRRGVERIFNEGSLTGVGKGQLLREYATSGDEAAFEALVTRYGPMVLSVCRRMLYDPRDVEDAFQATFLVLLRRAGSLGTTDPLSPWLHGVAYRVAAQIRANAGRRRSNERNAARSESIEYACEIDRHEVRGILDEEIHRLPERYRQPVVLCYLEGQTHGEAAQWLGCTAGSVRGRLDRERDKLRDRLVRRGVAPTAGLIGSALSEETASGAVPQALIGATVSTLELAATAISAAVCELADGLPRTMLLARLKLAASILAAGAVATAPGIVADYQPAELPPGKAVGEIKTGAVTVLRRGLKMVGRVVNGAGNPIAGAHIFRGADRFGMGIPRTNTDAAGRFHFADIKAGETILTVQAKGHGPDLKKIVAASSSPPVEFRLEPGRTIRGILGNEESEPLAGVAIVANGWRGYRTLDFRTTTDKKGQFEWPDAPVDEVSVTITHQGYMKIPARKLRPGGAIFHIVMIRELKIRGLVVDAETLHAMPSFTLVTGTERGEGLPTEWDRGAARARSAGRYEVRFYGSAAPAAGCASKPMATCRPSPGKSGTVKSSRSSTLSSKSRSGLRLSPNHRESTAVLPPSDWPGLGGAGLGPTRGRHCGRRRRTFRPAGRSGPDRAQAARGRGTPLIDRGRFAHLTAKHIRRPGEFPVRRSTT